MCTWSVDSADIRTFTSILQPGFSGLWQLLDVKKNCKNHIKPVQTDIIYICINQNHTLCGLVVFSWLWWVKFCNWYISENILELYVIYLKLLCSDGYYGCITVNE